LPNYQFIEPSSLCRSIADQSHDPGEKFLPLQIHSKGESSWWVSGQIRTSHVNPAISRKRFARTWKIIPAHPPMMVSALAFRWANFEESRNEYWTINAGDRPDRRSRPASDVGCHRGRL